MWRLGCSLLAMWVLLSLDTCCCSEKKRVQLPLCPPIKENAVRHQQDDRQHDILIVSTLDGQVTALDVHASGTQIWSVATGPGPMVSSSISKLDWSSNSKWIRLIPSLAGGVYKFDGESVEPVPMNVDSLLKASFKYADNTVTTGGKESRTYGIEMKSGKILYECSLSGCEKEYDDDDQQDKEENKLHDVLVVQRESQMVRAVEPRSGAEKWNFSVSQHHVQYHPGLKELCSDEPGKAHRNTQRQTGDAGEKSSQRDDDEDDEDDDDDEYSDDDGGSDESLLDGSRRPTIRAVISEGVICQTQRDSIVWSHKFASPIVHAWLLRHGKLIKVNLFSSKHLPRRQLDPATTAHQDQQQLLQQPLLYIGSYNNQLYIQESDRQRKQYVRTTDLWVPSVPFLDYARIAWKPYLISAGSQYQELPLLTHDQDQAQNTALMLVDPDRNDLSYATGFYLFSDEQQTLISNKSRLDVNNGGQTYTEPEASIEEALVSLWYWWKEVLTISLLTALTMNVILASPAMADIYAFIRAAFDRLLVRRAPDILVVERRIAVPYEVKVEVPVPQLSVDSSNSGGGSNVTLSSSEGGGAFVSRFLTDYEPLRCLGCGGFGVVFECKNKLDDVNYAVKRVRLPLSADQEKKVMREVKFLAKLDHKNIVRYYNTWQERPPPGWQENWDQWWQREDSDPTNPDFSCPMAVPPSSSASSVPKASSATTFGYDVNSAYQFGDQQSSSGGIVFEKDSGHTSSPGSADQEGTDCSVSESAAAAAASDKAAGKKDHDHDSGDEDEDDVCEALAWDRQTRHKRPIRTYLYIVMQLCQKDSLRHWLKAACQWDAAVRMSKVKQVFLEICRGVDYVHSQGLIHRDLKPSNIFFSYDGTVKIGDFGLVTDSNHRNPEDGSAAASSSPSSAAHPASGVRAADSSSYRHTDQVGTELYMSPEQLCTRQYCHKVDIYSLGMILLEMLVPFQTQMERINTMKSARSLHFPWTEDTAASKRRPEFDLVQRMVAHDPQLRPDASSILELDWLLH